MDFRITLDISARFEHALNNLADAMAHHPFAGYCDYDDKRAGEPHTPFAELLRGVYPPRTPVEAPEPAPESETPITQPEPETSQAAPTEPQETAVVESTEPEPIAVSLAAVEPAAPEPAPVDKPKKKRAQKKPVEAHEPAPEPEVVSAQPTPETAQTEAPVSQETAKSDSDPMAGMTVVDAVQALVNEIRDKDIDMATVNARVRAKANEIGLTYASAACLIKAIGYVEARRVALGEK